MAKKDQSEFRFRKTDTIGAVDAENDIEFLHSCFVETAEYEVLKDPSDIRQIILGRTGAGKSAMLERLKQEFPDNVIVIEPHELALAYVSNSTVIRYFSDLGVNLEPFFKLLWRHVLTVEVLKKHLNTRRQKGKNLWETLKSMFTSHSRDDKARREAVAYLEKWGEKFWLETEYRVREITRKLEEQLTAELNTEIKAALGKSGGSLKTLSKLSDQERAEIVTRGQKIVSDAQVQDLSKVLLLLKSVLSDRQKCYYILIDRLDENWVEERLRYRLIMALIEGLKELSRVPTVKVLAALRRDLIDRVFRLTRDVGFQEEKYHALYLPLHWTRTQLLSVLDKRVDALVARRYEKRRVVTHRDLLPGKVQKTPIGTFIAERAIRPRDVISFFNKCIESADGMQKLNVDTLKRAEGEYSRQRLRALGDEWNADYPGLLDFAAVLKRRSPSFKLGQISQSEIEDLCLKSAIEYPAASGLLREQANSVAESIIDPSDFKRSMIMVFYRTGLVGLKLESFVGASWVDDIGQSVSPAEIDDDTGVVVHMTYRRALGTRERNHKKL